MIQSQYGLVASIPIFIECGKLAKIIYGPESIQYASNRHSLAQTCGLTGDLVASLEHSKEASRLFVEILGADAPESIDVINFTTIIQEVLTRDAAEQLNKEQRLRQKLSPRVTDPKAPKASTGAPEKAVEQPAVVQKQWGQKANLSLEELVNFIEGTPAPRKRKASPPSATA